ncbi:MAG: hypothetical protein ACI86H_002824 [bacterium]|jgi:hypothetical protein
MTKQKIWELLSKKNLDSFFHIPSKEKLNQILTALFLYIETKTFLDPDISEYDFNKQVQHYIITETYQEFIQSWFFKRNSISFESLIPWINIKVREYKEKIFLTLAQQKPFLKNQNLHQFEESLHSSKKNSENSFQEIYSINQPEQNLLEHFTQEMFNLQKINISSDLFFLFLLRCCFGLRSHQIFHQILLPNIENLRLSNSVDYSLVHQAFQGRSSEVIPKLNSSQEQPPFIFQTLSSTVKELLKPYCEKRLNSFPLLPSDKILQDQTHFESFLSTYLGTHWSSQVSFFSQKIKSKITTKLQKDESLIQEAKLYLSENELALWKDFLLPTCIFYQLIPQSVTPEIIDGVAWYDFRQKIGHLQKYAEIRSILCLATGEGKDSTIIKNIFKHAEFLEHDPTIIQQMPILKQAYLLMLVIRKIFEQEVIQEVKQAIDEVTPHLSIELQLQLNSIAPTMWKMAFA